MKQNYLSADLHQQASVQVVQMPPISVSLRKEIHINHPTQRITESFF